MMVSSCGEKIVVAMSGGVDSSAAALLLSQQGYQVVGVSFQVWKPPQQSGRSDTTSQDFEDARRIADAMGFPFYVFDLEKLFRRVVVDPFIDSYCQGLTPNPCLECNRRLKFGELRNRAAAIGARKLATGHHVRIREKADGVLGLYTGNDGAKDQSYFLYMLTQDDLASSVFPVGEMTKDEVRAYLAKAGFSISSKEESQDICFVSGEVSRFIAEQRDEKDEGGEIVDSEGRVLGRHGGITGFTVGQRRGLGVSGPEPLYVVRIDADKGRVVIGPRRELERREFVVGQVNWICGNPPQAQVIVKMRYRHSGVLCEVEPCSEQEASSLGGIFSAGPYVRVRFLDGWSSVSPGQAAVFYRQEEEQDGAREILGGGTIQKACSEGNA